jgi:hypothetical protein
MTTSDNVAEWRRMCGELEAQNNDAFNRAMRYCAVVALLLYVTVIPFLAIVGAQP